MSVYSKNLNLLFVHIPKTAGKSIRKSMGRVGKDYQEVTNKLTSDKNYHSTYEICKQQIPEVESYYKFTVVRNPWDRVCSWYFFRKDIISNTLNNVKSSKVRKFKTPRPILEKEYEVMERDFNEWLHLYVDQPWDKTWFKLSDDQMTWITDVSYFDKICKYENLKADLGTIPYFKDKSLVKSNNSSNSDKIYKTLFSSESKKLIEELYRRDIEAFNYEF